MGRKRRSRGMKSVVPFLVIAVLVIVGLMFLLSGEDLLGLTGVSTIYVGYIAPLIGFGTLGYLMLEYPSRNTTTFAFITAGILFAVLLGEMNTNGLLVDDMLSSTVTIVEIQGVVILFGTLLGLIVRLRR